MLKNVDLKNMFNGYKPSPPESVWENIALKLAQDSPEIIGFWQFNSAQKITLIAASFISIFLSTFVFKINQPENAIAESVKNEPVIKSTIENNFNKPLTKTEVNYTKFKSETIFQNTNPNSVNIHFENSSSNTFVKTKTSSKIILSEELKPFKKRIFRIG